MERDEYRKLEDEFFANPYKAMLEILAINFETMETQPPTAYKCMGESMGKLLIKALSTEPYPRENLAWHQCALAWISWKISEKNPKTFAEKQAEKMKAIMDAIQFRVIPLDNFNLLKG